MRNLYIIPTMNRDSLGRAVKSILDVDKNATIHIKTGGKAGENRDSGLIAALDSSIFYDWIIFLDDDDYFKGDFLSELDQSCDIVVLRMLQYGHEIPDRSNEIRWQNVGINMALNAIWLEQNQEIFGYTELYSDDWMYWQKLLKHNPKIKVTDNIYYIAETKGEFKK